MLFCFDPIMPLTRLHPPPVPNDAFPRILKPEDSIQNAIQGVRRGVDPNFTAAASAYGQSASAVRHQKKGRKPPLEAHQHQQTVSAHKEQRIADCIRISEAWGLPVSVKRLRQMAHQVARHNVGVNWPQRFIQRHNLHTAFAATIDSNRAYNHDEQTVTDFVRLVRDAVKK